MDHVIRMLSDVLHVRQWISTIVCLMMWFPCVIGSCHSHALECAFRASIFHVIQVLCNVLHAIGVECMIENL